MRDSYRYLKIYTGTLLRKELMDPTPIHNIGAVDRLLLGMCSQPAMRRDEYIVDELTNHLFQTPSKNINNLIV